MIYLPETVKGNKITKFFEDIQTKVTTYLNSESTETSKTFVVMDDARAIKKYKKVLKAYGTRLIADSKGETPFTHISYAHASGNIILPIFQRQFGYLLSFGLHDRWTKFSNLFNPPKQKCISDNASYHKYCAMAMANAREQIIFHESDPVSLKSARNLFALWGVFVIISVLTIVKEIWYSNIVRHVVNGISRLPILYGLVVNVYKDILRRRSNIAFVLCD